MTVDLKINLIVDGWRGPDGNPTNCTYPATIHLPNDMIRDELKVHLSDSNNHKQGLTGYYSEKYPYYYEIKGDDYQIARIKKYLEVLLQVYNQSYGLKLLKFTETNDRRTINLIGGKTEVTKCKIEGDVTSPDIWDVLNKNLYYLALCSSHSPDILCFDYVRKRAIVEGRSNSFATQHFEADPGTEFKFKDGSIYRVINTEWLIYSHLKSKRFLEFGFSSIEEFDTYLPDSPLNYYCVHTIMPTGKRWRTDLTIEEAWKETVL